MTIPREMYVPTKKEVATMKKRKRALGSTVEKGAKRPLEIMRNGDALKKQRIDKLNAPRRVHVKYERELAAALEGKAPVTLAMLETEAKKAYGQAMGIEEWAGNDGKDLHVAVQLDGHSFGFGRVFQVRDQVHNRARRIVLGALLAAQEHDRRNRKAF